MVRRLGLVALALVGAGAIGCAHEPPPQPAPAPVATIQEPPHKAVDEEMVVAGTIGAIDEGEVAAPFNAQMTAFSQCFLDASATKAYLDGQVDIAVEIDAHGQPTQTAIGHTTLGSWDAERCMLSKAKTLSWAKPHGGDRARFSYALVFHAPRGAVDAPGLATAKPRLTRDIDRCSHKQPVDLTLWVGPGGKVVSFGVGSAVQIADDFGPCLTQKVRLWRLSDPRGKIARTSLSTAPPPAAAPVSAERPPQPDDPPSSRPSAADDITETD